jgi:hypothetical protein
VLLLCGQVVTTLLGKAGIEADSGYVTRLVSAIVAILNVQNEPPISAVAH